MKKIVVVLLVTILIAAIPACGSGMNPRTGDAVDSVSSEPFRSENTSSLLAAGGEEVLVESLEEFIAAAKPGATLLIPQQGFLISSNNAVASAGSYYNETV